MNKWICSALVAISASALTLGCTADLEQVGSAASDLAVSNALVPNALVPNALVPNALVPNALVPNALVPNALDPGALAAITDPGDAGALSRELLKYAVGCALGATQSFDFSWTDAEGVVHEESFPGNLGIAPGWASRPLRDETAQRLVSACLAARTNYFGTKVLISVRSAHRPLSTPTAEELAAYPAVEGAFWGNLFAPAPSLYACYDAANVANSRADLRDCAAGYPDGSGGVLPCGPIVLAGPCDAACTGFDDRGFYEACGDAAARGGKTNAVVTTALP